jgi:hypothetical protein
MVPLVSLFSGRQRVRNAYPPTPQDSLKIVLRLSQGTPHDQCHIDVLRNGCHIKYILVDVE